MKKWIVGATLTCSALVGSLCQAHTFGAEYMTDWGGCECNADPLSYTDDEINYFAERMRARGHSQQFLWGNSDVWASDMTEDRDFGGADHTQADRVEFFALASHGAVESSGPQYYLSPTCRAMGTESCIFSSKNARFGDRAGYYSSPNPGSVRFLMLLTCNSVDVNPIDAWGSSMYQGQDVVMGYRGLSADSFAIDEVAGDFVDAAYGDWDTLKAAWFWAIEDSFWVDDTGAILMSGTTQSDAELRRDKYSMIFRSRTPTVTHNWFAWAWHQG